MDVFALLLLLLHQNQQKTFLRDDDDERCRHLLDRSLSLYITRYSDANQREQICKTTGRYRDVVVVVPFPVGKLFKGGLAFFECRN